MTIFKTRRTAKLGVILCLLCGLKLEGITTYPAPAFLEKIQSSDDFNKLSGPSFYDPSLNLQQVLFVIDREHDHRIYYINSSRYQFHMDFLNDNYISFERGSTFISNNLDMDERRFILGFIIKRNNELYTFEFWEDDVMPPGFLSKTYRAIKSSFFFDIKFNPVSDYHKNTMCQMSPEVPVAKIPAMAKKTGFQALNFGTALGKLKFVTEASQPGDSAGTIVVTQLPPKTLLTVSGFATTEPVSALSHVCILARTLGIPAAFIADGAKALKSFEREYVRFKVSRDTYTISPATEKEARQWLKEFSVRARKFKPVADLNFREITDLENQTGNDSVRFGAKSANLGQVANFKIAGFEVPKGFTIPFYYYGEFIRENGIAEEINTTIANLGIHSDPEFRKKALKHLRDKIQSGKCNPNFKKEVGEKLNLIPAGKGVFVRSSTNAEDLPNFTGAGIYTTIPNVKGLENVMEAVKTVWGSIWNDRAFEAREIFGIEHRFVMPAILIQKGMNADSAGVMITRSDLSDANNKAVEVAAKKGLGIRVVEGNQVAERILYSPHNDQITLVNVSKDNIMLKFDERGGVKPIAIEPGQPVLSAIDVKRLAQIGLAIEKGFGGIPQDIEWLMIGDKIYLVQSRPYKFE